MTATDSKIEMPLSFGEITNRCTCKEYDEEMGDLVDSEHCFGDCWEDSVYFFGFCIEHLLDANESGHWAVDNLRLWHGNVSGYFTADNALDVLNGMTVNSEWVMRYKVFSNRVEYSLSHHDAPMGSASVLRPMRDDEPF